MKLKRISITCNEEEKKRILAVFEIKCPFVPYLEQCGEDARCDECLEDNIEFSIVEGSK